MTDANPGERSLRAVDYLAESLTELGVRHLFGVSGANIEDLYHALSPRPEVTAVVAKHEFAAATMADGYARSTNQLGVVAATSGGGALNLIAGLGEAHASRVPVLALVGQPPTALNGRGAFQDSSGYGGSFDAERLFGAVSRFCARVTDADALPALLANAVTAARAGGPAVLLLPKDVQQRSIDEPPSITGMIPPHSNTDASALPDATRELMRARAAGSPVLIIAGDEVARANARRELALLVDVLGASVAVAPDAKDVFDNRDTRFAGVAGVMGHPAVHERLTAAAVCVLVGTRLPLMTRGGLEPTLAEKTVVSIGLEPAFVPAAVSVVTRDLGAALGRLAGDLVTHDRAAVTHDRAAEAPPTPPHSLPSAGYTGAGIRYRDAVAAIESVLPADADVFVDAGNTGASAIHHLPAPKDGRFVVALGMGGMGYTFGAAIGAAFARGRRTYVIAGDGAFFMHGMEVHTALENDLPVTFIVFNNDAHAMCVTREQIYYGATYSYNRFRHAEIGVGMAAMFPGLRACHAKTTDELAEVLAETNSSGLPAFVSIDCDADEIPPFQPFLKEIASDEELVDVG